MANTTKRFTFKNLAILAVTAGVAVAGVSVPRYINAQELIKTIESMGCQDVSGTIVPGSPVDKNFSALYLCVGNTYVPIPKTLF